MTLSKKDLMKLIQEEKYTLSYLNKSKEDIKNGKYANESKSTQQIQSCSTEIGLIDHEARLAILNKILDDFYKPKKKQPTKLEFLTEVLKYIENRVKNNKSLHRYIIQWKYQTINETKEKIEKLKNIKQQRKEVFEKI